jgi:hypothetical protein
MSKRRRKAEDMATRLPQTSDARQRLIEAAASPEGGSSKRMSGRTSSEPRGSRSGRPPSAGERSQ